MDMPAKSFETMYLWGVRRNFVEEGAIDRLFIGADGEQYLKHC